MVLAAFFCYGRWQAWLARWPRCWLPIRDTPRGSVFFHLPEEFVMMRYSGRRDEVLAAAGGMKGEASVLARLRQLALSAGLALALAGCSGAGAGLSDYLFGGEKDGLSPGLDRADDVEPIAKLYNAGLEALKKKEYRTAAKKFAEVERQYPYSRWASKAVLMQAYAQYMRNDYDKAIGAAKKFLALHPGHKDAPYAHYLVALSLYEQIKDTKRDVTVAKKAREALELVKNRYPDTRYAADAERKLKAVNDHLAGKEMEVGRYYLKRGNYLAAINRFKRVIQDYQTTAHVPEALYRLVEAYLALGIRSEAQTAAAVLGHNFPDSPWYRDAYRLLTGKGLSPAENTGSWISRAFSKLVPG